MKILIISGFLESSVKKGVSKGSIQGVSRSIMNIIECLKDIKNLEIKVISQKYRNKGLISLSIDSYMLIPRIIITISKFKPDLIITQAHAAFPSIIISKIMKIPIIQLVRATSDFCPKFVNVIGYGKACSGIESRKKCFECINKWRTLRILIGNRNKGTEHSIRTSLVNILYKLRYFICSFSIYLMNKTNIVLVSSNIIKLFFSYKINQDKIKIINITPIKKYINKPTEKKKQLIFIRTYYEASHKGLDFVLRLSKVIPDDYKIKIVGGCKENWKGEELDNIKNYEFISSKLKLNKMYAESIATLVPTFCTEAFGRIIPESLSNKTPVISSPQCGANQFFKDKEFLKIVPLKIKLWKETINNIIQNPPSITNNDIINFYKQVSLEKSKKDFIKIIKKICV